MFAALLHGKLDRYLTRNPFDIEDLLTSVVIGACRCVPPDLALLPFLGTATPLDRESLSPLLEGVERVEYEFWPQWGALLRDASDAMDADGPVMLAARSEPEVVLTLHRANQPKALLLLEAKLHSGKSSHADGTSGLKDQLAKYWGQLSSRANHSGAVPLGVVYITTHHLMPRYELGQSQEDLRNHGFEDASIFWTSWRAFSKVVTSEVSPLDECKALLRKHWELVPIEEPRPWCRPPKIPPWQPARFRPWWSPPHVRAWKYGPNS